MITKDKEKECELLECGADDPDKAWNDFSNWASKHTKKVSEETPTSLKQKKKRLKVLDEALVLMDIRKRQDNNKQRRLKEEFWEDYEYWQENTQESIQTDEQDFWKEQQDKTKL